MTETFFVHTKKLEKVLINIKIYSARSNSWCGEIHWQFHRRAAKAKWLTRKDFGETNRRIEAVEWKTITSGNQSSQRTSIQVSIELELMLVAGTHGHPIHGPKPFCPVPSSASLTQVTLSICIELCYGNDKTQYEFLCSIFIWIRLWRSYIVRPPLYIILLFDL